MTIRWSAADVEQYEARGVARAVRSIEQRSDKACQLAGRKKAGRPKAERAMNKTEAEFAQHLEFRKAAGELVWWAFEPFRIRLADDTYYRPDFVTVDKSERTEIYEVKGHMREAARVRLKVAVEKLPYKFFLVRKHKGGLRVVRV